MDSNQSASNTTSADIFIEALQEAGVSTVFANFGSDHPGLIEALAKKRARGEKTPDIVLCPHETTALSAAHGFALSTNMPQVVFVHVDVGTANLGGTVHNAARSRVPILIFAGLTPFTLENELSGTRNSHINYLQDSNDQNDIVRSYVKWRYEIRTGANLKQIVFRAFQLSNSSPKGPVYLTAAREILAETSKSNYVDPAHWGPIAQIPAPKHLVEQLFKLLTNARFPIIITSYLGRYTESVAKLVRIAEAIGIAVVETTASHMNFPSEHPLHLGYSVDEVVEFADVILAIDTDVPMVISRTSPSSSAQTFFVDADPLKEDLPLWYMPFQNFIRADSPAFLDDLLQWLPLDEDEHVSGAQVRSSKFAAIHDSQREAWKQRLRGLESSTPTPEIVCETLSRIIDDRTIVVDETITSAETVSRYVPRSRPGTHFANGGSSLGWSGGASVGIKLAQPDRTVVSLVGDGSYLMSVPSSTYWIAEQYKAPFLTVVFDNGGWNATKQNLIKQYPHGTANSTDQYFVNLNQSVDFGGIASAAGGAHSATVTSVSDLEPVLQDAFNRVQMGQSAVVSVRLAAISQQHNLSD